MTETLSNALALLLAGGVIAWMITSHCRRGPGGCGMHPKLGRGDRDTSKSSSARGGRHVRQ